MKRRRKKSTQRTAILDNKKKFPVKMINDYVQKEDTDQYRVTRHLLERLLERSNQFELAFDESVNNFPFKEFKKVEKWLEGASIRYLFNNYFIVDDEFIFTVELRKKFNKKLNTEYTSIEFITFLGSVDENPMLHNLDVFTKKKSMYGNMKLQVPEMQMASVI